MSVARYLLGFAMLSATAAHAAAPPVPVPSDVAVTLTATPSSNLVPGQPIALTLTVTNLGPQPVTNLFVVSSDFVNQFEFISSSTDCFLVTVVVDAIDGTFFNFLSWNVANPPEIPELRVGETRTCHFELALTSQAPTNMPLVFGLPAEYIDINPNNDRATVVLRQSIEPAPIPALSHAMLLLLGGLMAVAAGMAHRASQPDRFLRRPLPTRVQDRATLHPTET